MFCCLQHCSLPTGSDESSADVTMSWRQCQCQCQWQCQWQCHNGNAHHSNSPSHRCSFSSTTSASMSARWWLVTTCVTTCVGLGSGSSVCHPSIPFMASDCGGWTILAHYTCNSLSTMPWTCLLHTFYRFTTITSDKAIFELTIIGIF